MSGMGFARSRSSYLGGDSTLDARLFSLCDGERI